MASGVPVPVANGIGGAVSSTVEQVVDIAQGNKSSFSGGQVAVEAIAGATVSKIGDTALQGVTKGRGNMAATFQGQVTRMSNGNSSTMSSTTIGKGVISGLVGGGNRTVANGVFNDSGLKTETATAVDTAAKKGACGALGVLICD